VKVGLATQKGLVFGFAQDSSVKVPGGSSLTTNIIEC